MLLCQNFCGSHQCHLLTVFHSQIGGCRGYHGFAAAHIALYQPIHGKTGGDILRDFPDSPFLRTGQRKGQGIIKGVQFHGMIGGDAFFCPGSTYKRKTGGENKEFLKNKPFFRQLRFCHTGRLVDGGIGSACIQNTEFPTYRLR